MSAVNQMFKDFEEVSKEGKGQQPGAAGGAPPELNDFLKNMMGG